MYIPTTIKQVKLIDFVAVLSMSHSILKVDVLDENDTTVHYELKNDLIALNQHTIKNFLISSFYFEKQYVYIETYPPDHEFPS